MKQDQTWKRILDRFLWAAIWMLPFFSYWIIYYRSGNGIPIFEFVNTEFSFDFIKNIIDNIWDTAFNGSTLAVSGYLSYLVAVEIAHCLFDAIIFIPRFAQSLIHRFTDFANEGGRKK